MKIHEMTDYKIITSYLLEGLEKETLQHIRLGWLPHSVFVVEQLPRGARKYHQAMYIKEEGV